MRAVNVCLSILVSLAIALLVFEGGLRLIGKGPKDTLNQFDPALGWSKKPDYRLVRVGKEFSVTFETNGLGLRDDPMDSPAKPPGTYRVIALGDSFTLGYTVDRDELFVDLLEQRWRAEGRNVEIINTGTEGYSTDQEVAWLLEHGADFDPDLVVLLPYDNDVFWCGQQSYTSFKKPMFTKGGSLVTKGDLPNTSGGWRRTTAIGRLVSGAPEVPMFTTSGGKRLPGDFAPLFLDPPSIIGDAPERVIGALEALEAECKELGSALIIAPIPSNASVDPDFRDRFGSDVLGAGSGEWHPDVVFESYLAAAGRVEIDAADARGAMQAAHEKKACYHDFFGPDREWHFNAAGNQAFADFLYTALDPYLPAKQQDAAPIEPSAAPGEGGGIPFWMVLYAILWTGLTALYFGHYDDEAFWLPPLKVGLILAFVFGIFMGVDAGVGWLSEKSPVLASFVLATLVVCVLGFVAYKMGSRIATMAELIKAFALRGHWYLMPMVVILLTIGSLLVVAASSPLVAPFIYTLF